MKTDLNVQKATLEAQAAAIAAQVQANMAARIALAKAEKDKEESRAKAQSYVNEMAERALALGDLSKPKLIQAYIDGYTNETERALKAREVIYGVMTHPLAGLKTLEGVDMTDLRQGLERATGFTFKSPDTLTHMAMDAVAGKPYDASKYRSIEDKEYRYPDDISIDDVYWLANLGLGGFM
jgi:hypothetical protein